MPDETIVKTPNFDDVCTEVKAVQMQYDTLIGAIERLDGRLTAMGQAFKNIKDGSERQAEVNQANNSMLGTLLDRIDDIEKKMQPGKQRIIYPSMSETIGKITEALSKAQVLFKDVEAMETPTPENVTAIIDKAKQSLNMPGFQPAKKTFTATEFADFDDLFRATREGLAANGLKLTSSLDTDEFDCYVLTMTLSHSSGEWMRSRALLHEDRAKSKAGVYHQDIALAEQYMKRIMYRSMLCIPNKVTE